mgnify:CR=1 FL=1
MHNMREKVAWAIAGVLALFVVVSMTGVVSGGPLDPPGAPSSTLPQVEPRNPIPPVGWDGTFPIVISQPGSYFLTRNLTGTPGQDGIDVSASDVTLDLNGFLIEGSGPSPGQGIHATVSVTGIVIKDGIIRGWPDFGINLTDATSASVSGVNVSSNSTGIFLGASSSLTDCTANNNTSDGILVIGANSSVSRCQANSNGSGGIRLMAENDLVRESSVSANLVGIELNGTCTGCHVFDNYASGNHVGIGFNQDFVVVEGNTSVGNSTWGFNRFGGGHSVLRSNVARHNGGGGCSGDDCGSSADYNRETVTTAPDDWGPIGTAAASTSPFANIAE